MTGKIGPYYMLTTKEGFEAPWYIIPFDKKGRCKAPHTRQHLIDSLESNQFTHVFLFSHGWNNDWESASKRYTDFITGFAQLRRKHDLKVADNYKPILIGTIWPSTSLVLPWERAPMIAAAKDSSDPLANDRDAFAADSDLVIADFADDLSDAEVERLYDLASAAMLDETGVSELAELLAPLLGTSDDLGDNTEIDPVELMEAWRTSATFDPTKDGFNDGDDEDEFSTVAPVSGGPQAAGLLSKLDPRHALRMASVWRMKDRAGSVGSAGVGPLLQVIQSKCKASIHLVGHSYGARVILSALAAGTLSRKIDSVLLLQPAISCLCFAKDVDGQGTPGGYCQVPDLVAQPIVTTYSKHDVALTKVFHLAVRRDSDLGEQRIAGAPPSRYAALGGFGPFGLESSSKTIPIQDPVMDYNDLGNKDLALLALEGSRTIGGHGEISNESTWWVLYEQARRA
jgi:pimeloyl-ACP methyl ester carboxylesterase